MKKLALFFAALGGAAFLQILVLRLAPGPAVAFDPFLVVVLWSSLGVRSPAPALLAGSAGGLVRDALTGGQLGLHGFAYTIAAWLLHGLRQRFVLHSPLQIVMLFSLVAAIEQALLALVESALVPTPELPGPVGILGLVATTGALGGILRVAGERLGSWVSEGRERRRRRLGLETRR